MEINLVHRWSIIKSDGGTGSGISPGSSSLLQPELPTTSRNIANRFKAFIELVLLNTFKCFCLVVKGFINHYDQFLERKVAVMIEFQNVSSG
jgi:hypothetical protein